MSPLRRARAILYCLVACIHFLAPLASQAVDVQWNFNQLFRSSPVKAHEVSLSGLFSYTSDGTNISIGYQTNRFFTDTNNVLVISNLLPGFAYRLTYMPVADQFYGSKPIPFTNFFPSSLTNRQFINGGDPQYLAVDTNSVNGSGYAYTRAQTDLLIANIPTGTNAGNVVGPPSATDLTFALFKGTGGKVLTNKDGLGATYGPSSFDANGSAATAAAAATAYTAGVSNKLINASNNLTAVKLNVSGGTAHNLTLTNSDVITWGNGNVSDSGGTFQDESVAAGSHADSGGLVENFDGEQSNSHADSGAEVHGNKAHGDSGGFTDGEQSHGDSGGSTGTTAYQAHADSGGTVQGTNSWSAANGDSSANVSMSGIYGFVGIPAATNSMAFGIGAETLAPNSFSWVGDNQVHQNQTNGSFEVHASGDIELFGAPVLLSHALFGPSANFTSGFVTNGGSVLYYTNGAPQVALPNGSHCFQSNGQEWSRTNNSWVAINITGTGSGGTGNVVGPNSSVANHLAGYADTSGSLLIDTGLPLANVVLQAALNVVSNSIVTASQTAINAASNSVVGASQTAINNSSNSLVSTAQFIANVSSNLVYGNSIAAMNAASNTVNAANLFGLVPLASIPAGVPTNNGPNTLTGDLTDVGTFTATSVKVTGATASTLPLFDGGKNIVSLANPSGAGTFGLTFNGGTFSWLSQIDGSALKASQYTATGSTTNLISTLDGSSWTNMTFTSAVIPPSANATNYTINFSGADKQVIHSANTNAHFTFSNIVTNRQLDIFVYAITSSVNCLVDFPPHVIHNNGWTLTCSNGTMQAYHVEAHTGTDATNVTVTGGDYYHRD